MSHTPGPWIVATSNSWRRIVARDMTPVCEPIVHHRDNHPDLYFRNGGADGPDARLMAAAPELLAALERLLHDTEPDDSAPWVAGSSVEQARKVIAKVRG